MAITAIVGALGSIGGALGTAGAAVGGALASAAPAIGGALGLASLGKLGGGGGGGLNLNASLTGQQQEGLDLGSLQGGGGQSGLGFGQFNQITSAASNLANLGAAGLNAGPQSIPTQSLAQPGLNLGLQNAPVNSSPFATLPQAIGVDSGTIQSTAQDVLGSANPSVDIRPPDDLLKSVLRDINANPTLASSTTPPGQQAGGGNGAISKEQVDAGVKFLQDQQGIPDTERVTTEELIQNLQNQVQQSQARVQGLRDQQNNLPKPVDPASQVSTAPSAAATATNNAATGQTQQTLASALNFPGGQQQATFFAPNSTLTRKVADTVAFISSVLHGNATQTPAARAGGNVAQTNQIKKDLENIAALTQLTKNEAFVVAATPPAAREKVKQASLERILRVANIDAGAPENAEIVKNVSDLLDDPGHPLFGLTMKQTLAAAPELLHAAIDPTQNYLDVQFEPKTMAKLEQAQVDAVVEAGGVKGASAVQERMVDKGLLPPGEVTADQYAAAFANVPKTQEEIENGPKWIRAMRHSDGVFPGIQSEKISDAQKTFDIQLAKEVEAARQKEQFEDVDAFLLPDGRQRLSRDGGKTFRENGQDVPMPDGAIPLTTRQTGTPDQLRPAETSDFREKEINTRNFITLAERTKPIMRNREEILSNPGAFVNAVNSMVNQMDGFAKLSGMKFEVDGKPATPEQVRAAAEERVDDTLVPLSAIASDRARLKSATIGLAYSAAAAAGQSGKALSDKDVQFFFRRIGENADPRVFESVVIDMEREMVDNLKNSHIVFSRFDNKIGEFPDDLEGLITGPDGKSISTAGGGRFSTASREELTSLLNVPGLLESLSPEETAAIKKRGKALGIKGF